MEPKDREYQTEEGSTKHIKNSVDAEYQIDDASPKEKKTENDDQKKKEENHQIYETFPKKLITEDDNLKNKEENNEIPEISPKKFKTVDANQKNEENYQIYETLMKKLKNEDDDQENKKENDEIPEISPKKFRTENDDKTNKADDEIDERSKKKLKSEDDDLKNKEESDEIPEIPPKKLKTENDDQKNKDNDQIAETSMKKLKTEDADQKNKENDRIDETSMKKLKIEEDEFKNRENDEIPEISPKKFEIEYDVQKNKEEKEQKREEEHFLKLYTLVLDNVIRIKNVSEDSIRDSIISIKESFNSKKTGRVTFDEIDFTKWENVCAYMYLSIPLGAGLTRNRLLNALKKLTEAPQSRNDVLQVFDERVTDLRVINLGSGPGNNAVGFCSALAEWYRVNDWKCPSNVTVTLVDKYKEFLSCAKLAMELIDFGRENFGNAAELLNNSNVKFNYLQVELDKELIKEREKYFEALKEADVILIPRLLCILKIDQCKKVLQSLKENMKKDAFIFLIDQYIPLWVTNWNDFDLIYTSDECDAYESSAHAEPRFSSNAYVQSTWEIRILRLKS